MDVLTGKLVSNPSVYQIPYGDTGASSLRTYAKIPEPSRGSRAFGLAAELLKQCIAGDLLPLSGWRLGAHRFDVAWINGVPSSPGDVTINQDFLYGPHQSRRDNSGRSAHRWQIGRGGGPGPVGPAHGHHCPRIFLLPSPGAPADRLRFIRLEDFIIS
jgi:hypothetical protein